MISFHINEGEPVANKIVLEAISLHIVGSLIILQVPPTETPLQDPTWEQLLAFLQEDDTDALPYVYPTFVCEDFAQTLQANAEKAGWKCAIVTIQLSGYPDFYNYGIPSNTGHSCNAFNTTDRGLVYIDDTGMPTDQPHPSNMDSIVDIQVGQPYVPISLSPEAGWMNAWSSMGIVTSVNIEW